MHLLVIITGSIAAFRTLEFIRLARTEGFTVTPVLTEGGKQFVTPMSVAALAGRAVYDDLFSLKDESEMGHIRLSREADLVVVAPASADILAKMTAGMANDLASTLLLATDKPVLVAPAMNPQMWDHPATQRNVAQLKQDGIHFCGPEGGLVACGEEGTGRMASPEQILQMALAITGGNRTQPLRGLHALVTAGPTFEALDDVRFLGNRSSGKQGYAIAEALAALGASVTLVSGPTALEAPKGVQIKRVESAQQMLHACYGALPADLFIGTAAVADWTPADIVKGKIKKEKNRKPPTLQLTETTDILQTIGQLPKAERPRLVIGFAAESAADDTELEQLAAAKRKRKGCDWLLANNVANGQAFGRDQSRLYRLSPEQGCWWPEMEKAASARKLASEIAHYLEGIEA